MFAIVRTVYAPRYMLCWAMNGLMWQGGLWVYSQVATVTSIVTPLPTTDAGSILLFQMQLSHICVPETDAPINSAATEPSITLFHYTCPHIALLPTDLLMCQPQMPPYLCASNWFLHTSVLTTVVRTLACQQLYIYMIEASVVGRLIQMYLLLACYGDICG